MLRRAWKPIVGSAVLVGAPAYFYYRYSKLSKPETFDLTVKVRGADGKPTMTTRTFPLIPNEQVDARINEHASSQTTVRPGGLIWKQTTAHLASNNPIEDAHASAIVQRDPTDLASPGDLLFFAVMDGHRGPQASQLLSKVLIPAVALELFQLTKAADSQTQKKSALESLKSSLYPTATASIPSDSNPERVVRAIQIAFTNLDSELINAPLRILAEHADKLDLAKGKIPDLSQHPMALASMQPAIAGSCAIMALFDTAHKNLYVACTGDSRAVAGVFEESEDGEVSWRVEVLSEDQTGRNPSEVARIQSEHPPDEASTVISRGRVLGGLEPTRAFGDAYYKWPREVQAVLNQVFMKGTDLTMRAVKTTLKTPPYVTARPEVTHHKLSFSDQDTSNPKSTLKFLVLATDGLWDELASEDVVALVAGHFAGLKGNIPKSTLPSLVKTSIGTPTVDGKEGKHRRDRTPKGSWAFVDENVSAHLIRNALGGADETYVRKLLSIPPGLSRNYRDDITVTVVWWEDGRESSAQVSEQKIQSKL